MNMIHILNIVLVVTTALYCVGLILFCIGLFFPNKSRQKESVSVSVVIAVRNEEDNIAHLLSDLIGQTYPKDRYEVIIINDHSDDGTVDVVQRFCNGNSNVRLIHASEIEKGFTPKKNAIYQGIKNSRGEIILMTDGDCRVLPSWVETMVSYFQQNVGMVVGFSQLGLPEEKRPFFQRLQATDFLSLMAAAQGSLNFHWPLAASGQNLAYRREAFEEVGGFSRIGHRVSGDDVLLLQLVHQKTHWKIHFAPLEDCFNVSPPEENLHDLLNQRKRWASNGAYQLRLNKIFFLYVVTTFLVNLSLLVHFPVYIILSKSLIFPLICLMMKCVAEGLLLTKGCHVYKRFDLFKLFPVWFLLQIPYVVFVGFLGSIGHLTWKKRIHTIKWEK